MPIQVNANQYDSELIRGHTPTQRDNYVAQRKNIYIYMPERQSSAQVCSHVLISDV